MEALVESYSDKDKMSYDAYAIKAKVLNIDSVSDKVLSYRGVGGGGFSYGCYATIAILEVSRMSEKGESSWPYKAADELKIFARFPRILAPGDIISGELRKYQVKKSFTYHVLYYPKIGGGA